MFSLCKKMEYQNPQQKASLSFKTIAQKVFWGAADDLIKALFGGGDAAQDSSRAAVQGGALSDIAKVENTLSTANLGVAVCPNKPEYGGSIGQP